MGSSDADKVHAILESENEVTDKEADLVKRLIDKADAKQDAEAAANSYIEEAFSALKALPQNEHVDTLKEIANYVLDRND
ncbi:MAG: hypothetical protein PHO93_03335 [Candidatus Saccharimonadaceae bacterium]|nr:hypothetical protein [Candidatus Saccharimonadaceae bacterium]